MKYTLYNYWRSSSSWRVRIALEWKGLPYTYVGVPLLEGAQKRDDYAALNPMRQVPTLVVTDDAGAQHELAQSLAIIEYLEETHPAPPLLPRDPLARARVRQLAEIVNSGIQPHQNTGTLAGLARLGGDGPAWARGFIAVGLSAMEAIARKTAGRFLVGDEVSIADLCLVPQLYGARRFGAPLDGCPTLLRIEEACAALEPFRRAHADVQPDATAPKQS
jgi:maleylpyruvate isomerase